MNKQVMKRSPNFSVQEEELLLAVIGKYKHIIECKQSDHVNLRRKDEAWDHIETDFNASSKMVHRGKETLLNKYSNIKKRSKKKFADEKTHIIGSGGGAPLNVNLSSTDHAVANLLGARMTGLTSTYDDDTCENNSPQIYKEQPNEWQHELLQEQYIDEEGLEVENVEFSVVLYDEEAIVTQPVQQIRNTIEQQHNVPVPAKKVKLSAVNDAIPSTSGFQPCQLPLSQ